MKSFYLSLFVLLFPLVGSAQLSLFGQQSKIETKTMHSEVLSADRDYNIYLPKSYGSNPDKKYPILYLLHGIVDTNKDWTEKGHVKEIADQLVASGEAREMIIVMPNAGGDLMEGAWNGYFNMEGWEYEKFFFTEFVPYIERTYQVIGNKANRAIAGLSMGGGGATGYGQRHSSMFGSVYAMSALMSATALGDIKLEKQDPKSKTVLFTKSVLENNIIQYIQQADDARKESLQSVAWFVDCGDDDFLLDANIEFAQAMRKAGIPFQFRVRDGGHTWEYWRSALYTCLPFVSRNFDK